MYKYNVNTISRLDYRIVISAELNALSVNVCVVNTDVGFSE